MKKFLSCLLLVALIFTATLPVSAATSKTGTEVTGKEVLEFVHDNVPTEAEMTSGKEAELAVVIQTREFASLKKHGFTVANFGAVLAKDGIADGKLPRPATKKNWTKCGWKYITDGQPKLYLNTFTNTNEEKGIYQKKDEYDAYKDKVVYYSGIGSSGKTQSSAANVSCLYDEDNALYIKEENTFFKYEIRNPENDEIIGYMFIEKNPYIKSAEPKPEEVVSILGDSISTYEGWLPNGFAVFYPEGDITDVNKTWWQIALNETGYTLGTNASSSGCTCVGDSTSSDVVVASTDVRINALGESKTPTKVIIYLGTNDLLASYPLGSNNGTSSVSEGNVDNFADAYTLIIDKINKKYPDAEVYCCTLSTIWTYDTGSFAPAVNGNGDTIDSFNSKISEIAGNKNATVIDISNIGVTGDSNVYEYLQDGVHPTVKGHEAIGKAVASAIK